MTTSYGAALPTVGRAPTMESWVSMMCFAQGSHTACSAELQRNATTMLDSSSSRHTQHDAVIVGFLFGKKTKQSLRRAVAQTLFFFFLIETKGKSKKKETKSSLSQRRP